MSEKLSNGLSKQSIQDTNDPKTDKEDFLLVFRKGDLAEAVHALYYLPENYKLMILNKAASDISWADATIKGRVSFEGTEGAGIASAANAIISDDEVQVSSTDAPYVFVSSNASNNTIVENGSYFTVPSGSPEALASAVLRIARAAHA